RDRLRIFIHRRDRAAGYAAHPRHDADRRMIRFRHWLPLLLAFPVLSAAAQSPAPVQVAATVPSPAPVPDPDYDACMVRMKAQAATRGVPAARFERFMSGVTADRSVLDLLNAQPEFTTPIWDYLAGLVDDERVADGKAMLET